MITCVKFSKNKNKNKNKNKRTDTNFKGYLKRKERKKMIKKKEVAILILLEN